MVLLKRKPCVLSFTFPPAYCWSLVDCQDVCYGRFLRAQPASSRSISTVVSWEHGHHHTCRAALYVNACSKQDYLLLLCLVLFVPWIHFEACARQVAIEFFPLFSLFPTPLGGRDRVEQNVKITVVKIKLFFFLFLLLLALHIQLNPPFIFITIQMEKSYNVPRLTMHRRLVNSIYLGSICSFGRTENTTKATLAIIQTNKNMEAKEQTLRRCNFFWDSDSLKEKAEKATFDALWVINSHVCSCNVCHKEVFPPPACGVNVLSRPCITK